MSREVFLRLLSTTASGDVSRVEQRHTEAEQEKQSSQRAVKGRGWGGNNKEEGS